MSLFSIEEHILFEDNHIIVVIKQPGILSQGGEKNLPNMVDLLKDYVKEKYHKPGNVFIGLVHRLDLNVGGVMVFAKTSKAASRLSDQIRNNLFQKKYIAILEGKIPKTETNILVHDLIKDEKKLIGKVVKDGTGKQAKLMYEIIEYSDLFQGLSLVKIELETGRFHQIRTQFSHIGYPLLGDIKYGAKTPVETNFLGLWAYQLGFYHPITKEEMTFTIYPSESYFCFFSFLNQNEKKEIS